MTEVERLRRALEQDFDTLSDWRLRMVYADALDEEGEDGRAAAQREAARHQRILLRRER